LIINRFELIRVSFYYVGQRVHELARLGVLEETRINTNHTRITHEYPEYHMITADYLNIGDLGTEEKLFFI